MKGEDRTDWATAMRRLSDADDTAAISFARDLIKFGQWLNGGAIAALPVVAGALGLAGSALLAAFGLPALLFLIGLACSAFSTCFAFLAMASRSASRLTISDAITIEAAFPDPSTPHSTDAVLQALADARKMRAESNQLHSEFRRRRIVALGFAVGSVCAFIAGVAVASKHLLA